MTVYRFPKNCPSCGGNELANMVGTHPVNRDRDRYVCNCGVWMNGHGNVLLFAGNERTELLCEADVSQLRRVLAQIIINPNKMKGYGCAIIAELERRKEQKERIYDPGT